MYLRTRASVFCLVPPPEFEHERQAAIPAPHRITITAAATAATITFFFLSFLLFQLRFIVILHYIFRTGGHFFCISILKRSGNVFQKLTSALGSSRGFFRSAPVRLGLFCSCFFSSNTVCLCLSRSNPFRLFLHTGSFLFLPDFFLCTPVELAPERIYKIADFGRLLVIRRHREKFFIRRYRVLYSSLLENRVRSVEYGRSVCFVRCCRKRIAFLRLCVITERKSRVSCVERKNTLVCSRHCNSSHTNVE